MEDINGAINFGVQITHNENIGYIMGSTLANSHSTDCSDFVWWCLKNNGFNVPASRWSTTTMIPYLQAYTGFTEYIYTDGFQWEHGDIAVYDEGGGSQGHTFFYAENVNGYLNTATPTPQILTRARVEASQSDGYTDGVDHRYNGTGAYYLVWTHDFYFTPNNHTWHIFRWGGEPPTPTTNKHLKSWIYTRKDNNTKFIFQ